MSFILQSYCCLCRYLVFEGKAADSVTSVELYQVKTVGVARDPDAGTKLCFEYVVEFEPQTCALCNLSFPIIYSLPSSLVFLSTYKSTWCYNLEDQCVNTSSPENLDTQCDMFSCTKK